VSAASAVASALRRQQAGRWLVPYLWAVMALLLVQGGASLVLRLAPELEARTPWLLATLANGNLPHAVLHVAWGLAGLLYLALVRSARARRPLAVVFGVFYTSLGLLGLLVQQPFGLRLEFPENLFHLTVGPVMLVLAWLARRPLPAPAQA
jgi:hypothetical protein